MTFTKDTRIVRTADGGAVVTDAEADAVCDHDFCVVSIDDQNAQCNKCSEWVWPAE